MNKKKEGKKERNRRRNKEKGVVRGVGLPRAYGQWFLETCNRDSIVFFLGIWLPIAWRWEVSRATWKTQVLTDVYRIDASNYSGFIVCLNYLSFTLLCQIVIIHRRQWEYIFIPICNHVYNFWILNNFQYFIHIIFFIKEFPSKTLHDSATLLDSI